MFCFGNGNSNTIKIQRDKAKETQEKVMIMIRTDRQANIGRKSDTEKKIEPGNLREKENWYFERRSVKSKERQIYKSRRVILY